MAKAKQKAQGIQCINNNRQLGLAWLMYAHDNGDRVVNNYDATFSILKPLDTWLPNGMTWDNSPMTTNFLLLQFGKLGTYTVKNYAIFKCPADVEPSAAGRRVRSISMNAFVGDRGNGLAINPGYQQFRKLRDFRNPASVFVFLDEHPDSINDGFFVFCGNSDPANFSAWSDLPSSLHGAPAVSCSRMAMLKIKRWLASSTKRNVKKNTSGLPVTVGSDDRDIRWIADKSTFKLF